MKYNAYLVFLPDIGSFEAQARVGIAQELSQCVAQSLQKLVRIGNTVDG